MTTEPASKESQISDLDAMLAGCSISRVVLGRNGSHQTRDGKAKQTGGEEMMAKPKGMCVSFVKRVSRLQSFHVA